MKLTPGEIYFIGERDHLTGKQTPFFKIGMVRADENRTSSDRLKEHQTGNPRPLFIHEVVLTDVVERVESLLHRLYAKQRGSGEWFKFNLDQLQDAINTAKMLSAEAAENSTILMQAADLAKQISNDIVLPATDTLIELRRQHFVAELTVKEFTNIDKVIRDVIRDAIAQGQSVGGVAQVKNTGVKEEFNEPKFKSENEVLFAQYCDTVSKLVSRLDFKKPKDLTEFETLLQDKVYPVISEIRQAIDKASSNEIPKSDLNKWHLVVLENIAMAEWTKEITDAQIRVAVGTNAGIEGICSWRRKMGEKSTFNSARFREENFELYKSYLYLKQTGGGLEMAAGQAQGKFKDE
jgi:arginyl-tRNA--protein-N-Asp/Glu arginylyltransferase